MHGVGVSAVNALSEWCEVRVFRDDKIYFQRYEKGIPQAAVKEIGKAPKNRTGTVTTFKYDQTLFKGDFTYRFETLGAAPA